MEDKACVMEALHLAGSIVLENGGETYRVEDTVERLGLALGAAEVQVFAVTSGVFITLTFSDGTLETKVHRSRRSGTQLHKVDEVNRISRRAAAGEIGPWEALEALRRVRDEKPAFPMGWRLMASAVSAAGFAVMFGGGAADFAVTFFTGVAIQALVEALARLTFSRVLQSLLGGVLCTLIPLLFHALTGLGVVDAMVAGALMPLLPGLAMTNAVQDTMRGDMLSGVGHAMQAVLTAALVAGGGVIASRLFILMGEVI